MTLAEQVEDRISDVTRALDEAIYDLEDGLFHPPGTAATVARLKQMRPNIDTWSSRGRAAVPTGKAPGVGGWGGWLDAGNLHIKSIAQQRGEPVAELLQNIDATAMGIKDDANKAAAKAAKAAEATVHRAAAAVGDAAGAITAPLALPLGLLAVGLVAVAVIFLKVKP